MYSTTQYIWILLHHDTVPSIYSPSIRQIPDTGGRENKSRNEDQRKHINLNHVRIVHGDAATQQRRNPKTTTHVFPAASCSPVESLFDGNNPLFILFPSSTFSSPFFPLSKCPNNTFASPFILSMNPTFFLPSLPDVDVPVPEEEVVEVVRSCDFSEAPPFLEASDAPRACPLSSVLAGWEPAGWRSAGW